MSLGQAAKLLGWDTRALDEHETGHECAQRYPLTDIEWQRLASLYHCSVAYLRGDPLPDPHPDLMAALDAKAVSPEDRATVIEFAQMLSGMPPQPSARERLAAVAARHASDPESMPPLSAKVRYVKSQGQTRAHHCHWPGCTRQVPPAKWGCYFHWMKLPKRLRDRIWAAYRPGKEVNMTPSDEYLQVADEVQQWIREQGAKP